MSRTILQIQLTSGEPTNIVVPAGIVAQRALLVAAAGLPETPYWIVVTDANFVSPPNEGFQVRSDSTYQFNGPWSGGTTIGTAQLQAAGEDIYSPPGNPLPATLQPPRVATFQLFIDY